VASDNVGQGVELPNEDLMIAESLKNDIEAYAEQMRQSPLLQLAREGKIYPATVAAYVSTILHLIQHTPIYLERAHARAKRLDQHELAAYFAHKLSEEIGHDRWAEQDLAKVSGTFHITAPKAPSPSVAALVDYLRRAIDEEPARYLAYILFAEYFTVLVGPEWLAALEQGCGIPASSLSVVARHIELDQAHVAQGLAEIDALVPDPARLAPLRETLFQSMRYFSDFCNELAQHAA
jgi:pyrroloquinoline quinone (PQQ) biosynthesis protein C